jgi:hypothetical protein
MYAQTYTISGYVKDSNSGEDMIGTSILVKEINKGTITNTYGFYSISVKKGTYTIVISFLGYKDIEKKIVLDKNIKLNLSLKETSFTTDEVIISAERTDKNIRNNKMGIVKLPMETIKKLPAFMGEVDIIKSIQLMPGVSSAGEGNGGFYVRGGGPDQNLVLLDGATVYNASHLFGFFSVFNADAIKDVNLIKGGMPAKYGGRLSSVLDISMKEGNNQKLEVEGGIGNIASRLTVQGPIIKDKASFIISGRRTYIDILMDPFIKETAKAKGSGYYFYDITGKVNYKFSDNDRVFLSGYYGKDVFSFVRKDQGFDVQIPWGNAMGTIRWNHLFNNKLFMNTTLVMSDYKFAFEAEQDDFELKMYSGIRDYSAKANLTWFAHVKHKIYFGGEYIRHIFTPSSVSGSVGETNFDSGKINKQYANDFAIYLMDEYEWNEFFSVNFGLRGTLYQNVGPYDRYVINDQNINTDTIQYENGDVIAQYPNIEPRISLRYILNSKSSLKASFTQNYQYVHLANVASASLPTDVWVSSTDVVKPQFSTQYSLGYFKNFKDNMFETSIEVYYKDMKNMIEYADGKTPGDDVGNNADNNFVFGNGYSFGAEFFVKKSFGKINGWIGYTISKTARIFPDINYGLEFPAKYDRRHDLSVIASYEINKKLYASLIFIYATGDATTLPLSRYMIDGRLSVEYGGRNSFRLAPYHRADFSVTWEPGALKDKKFKSTWVFAVYNFYNRQNPYFIYFDQSGNIQEGDYKVSAMQISLFPILPSITWNFKF